MRIEVATPNLTAPEAHVRLVLLGEHLRKRYGISTTWSGNRAVFAGSLMLISFAGIIEIVPGMVVLIARDINPAFQRKAESFAGDLLRKYLDTSTPVAALR